jgi:phospholipid/cholesterol/gamma-HCH transport system substrate-binding protein
MKTELKVGVFVLLGLGVLGYLSLNVSDAPTQSSGGITVTAYFDNVAGLVRGAEVRAAGVRVGRVQGIELERGKARVELELFPGVKLPRDSQASISSLGLLGEKYVEIKPGTFDLQPGGTPTARAGAGGAGGGQGGGADVEVRVGGGALREGDVIVVQPTRGLEEIGNLASEIGDDVKIIVGEVRRAVGEAEDNRVLAILASLERFSASLERVVAQNERGIERIVGNVEQSTETLRELLAQNRQNVDRSLGNVASITERMDRLLERNDESVTALVGNLRELSGALRETLSENREAIGETIGNVRSTSAALDERLPQVLSRLDSVMARVDRLLEHNSEGISASVTNVRAATGQVEQAADRLENIFTKIDEGEGTIGKLINQDAVHENLNLTLSSVRDTLGGFQKFRTVLMTHAEGRFSDGAFGGQGYFGIELQPDARKFYRILATADDEGVEFRERFETTIRIGEGEPTRVVTEQRSFRDQVGLTGVFGYRFDRLNVYTGIIEYRGGLGVEYYLPGRRAWLQFEAFDFGHPVAPHLRLRGNLRLTRNFWASAGWDDPLSSERGGPTLGLGFAIQDDDIRNLIGLAASGL